MDEKRIAEYKNELSKVVGDLKQSIYQAQNLIGIMETFIYLVGKEYQVETKEEVKQ